MTSSMSYRSSDLIWINRMQNKSINQSINHSNLDQTFYSLKENTVYSSQGGEGARGSAVCSDTLLQAGR
jgi:hypothetical protein